ncbi:MAG: hypothetical protein WBO36_03300, partial [Saprospiraceae bacterium]
MLQFITDHKEVTWALIVVICTSMLVFISVKTLRFIERKWKKGKEYELVFISLRKLSRIFFTAFGIGLLSYLFVDKTMYSTINNNLGRVIWFGLVASITIVMLAISQGYFRNKIDRLSRRDQGDITLFKYLSYLSTSFIFLFGIILIAIAIPALRNVATAAGASAGALALVAGVAAQEG